MALPNVLVGVITHKGDMVSRGSLMPYLKMLQDEEPNPAVIIVTNSGEEDKKALEDLAEKCKLTCTVIVNASPADNRLDIIVQNRNMVREFFLDRDYSHLFMLDADVTGGTNMIAVLSTHDKPLVAGWYLNGVVLKGKERIRPVAFAPVDPKRVRLLRIDEVLRPQLIPLAVAGLGCTLTQRKVLENISFRRISEKGGEDVAFFKDAFDILGERVWLDTRVKCIHHKFPAGDERNKLLDPRNYQLKEA